MTTEIKPVSEELVSHLLAEKLAGEFQPRHRQQKRLLDFSSETLYMIGLSITIGVSTSKLDWDSLNLKSELSGRLKKGNVSLPSIQVFPELRTRGNKLRGMWREAEKYLQYAEPYWFCREQNLPEILEVAQNILDTAEEFRQELKDNYSQHFEDYIQRLGDVLLAAKLSNEKRVELLSFYAGKFPSMEDLDDYLTVVLQGPVRIPSLAEQAAADAELARELADKEISEQRLREVQALSELQKQWILGVQEQFAKAGEDLHSEFKNLILHSLTKMESTGTARMTSTRLEKLKSNLERLEVLLQFDSSLYDLYTQVQGLALEFTSGSNQDDDDESLKSRIDAIKASLEAPEDLPTQSSKSIAAFML